MRNLKLMLSDFKMIFREKSLRTFLFMPLIILVVVMWALPALVEAFPVVLDYVGYVLMGASLQTATMYGFIYCMVFIDEKDLNVSKVYGILPISKKGFVLVRLIPSVFFSVLFAAIILSFQQFYTITGMQILLVSLMAGLVSPIMTLIVAILSKNKMEGMTWYKIINTALNLPLLAFFIPDFALFFGILPTHWIFQSMDHFFVGASSNLLVVIGIVYSLVIIAAMDIRFSRVHFR